MGSEMKMMIERRLYEASLEGDITSLMELLEEDPLILEKVITSFTESPLHIAAMFGHVDFAKELLRRKHDLTSELDSHGFSPLHLAASRKSIDMVKLLLSANPNACSVTDQEGRTPLHLAAMKGRIEAMKELIRVCPEAIQVQGQETILHLCVKHNRLEALKLLLAELIDNNEIRRVLGDSSISINSVDGDGNTILHLAVAKKQLETIMFLLDNNKSSTKGIQVNSSNKCDLTPLDVLMIQSARDLKDFEIGEFLRGAGCSRAPTSSPAKDISVQPLSQGHHWMALPPPPPMNINDNHHHHEEEEEFSKWLDNTRNSLMVVATLIATMAFQTGLSPPGGVWGADSAEGPSPIQEDKYTNPSHHSGMSVLAMSKFNRSMQLYSAQVFFNTIGFLASLSIILLLLSGLHLIKRKFFVWILVVVMWIAITSITFSYGIILYLTNEDDYYSWVFRCEFEVWAGLMCLIIVLHFKHLICKWCKLIAGWF